MKAKKLLHPVLGFQNYPQSSYIIAAGTTSDSKQTFSGETRVRVHAVISAISPEQIQQGPDRSNFWHLLMTIIYQKTAGCDLGLGQSADIKLIIRVCSSPVSSSSCGFPRRFSVKLVLAASLPPSSSSWERLFLFTLGGSKRKGQTVLRLRCYAEPMHPCQVYREERNSKLY